MTIYATATETQLRRFERINTPTVDFDALAEECALRGITFDSADPKYDAYCRECEANVDPLAGTAPDYDSRWEDGRD